MEKRLERPAGRSGDRCEVTGFYACQMHPHNRIPLSFGRLFPLCAAANGHKATWLLLESEDQTDPEPV